MAKRVIERENKGGGPAFPTDIMMECPECEASVSGVTPHEGLTKRQYFVGQAIAGLMANPDVFDETSFKDTADLVLGGARIARVAHVIADAALSFERKEAEEENAAFEAGG